MIEDGRLLLSARDAAKLLGMGERTLHRHNSAGRIPAPVKVGGRWVYRRMELIEWTRAGCPPRARWAWPAPGR